METVQNIFHLGIKEFRSLLRDPAMLILIGFSFSIDIYMAAHSVPENLQRASIAVIDEDHSVLSNRIVDALYPPYFNKSVLTSLSVAERGVDTSRYSFVLDIPSRFQEDVIAGRNPAVQLNVDGTLVSQAYTGAASVSEIIGGQVPEFIAKFRSASATPSELQQRTLYNPNLTQAWFSGVMELINNVTMLSIILTGAALVREREHGTIEHLLVMPLTPFQIMASKVWSMGVVVLLATTFGLLAVIRGAMGVMIAGSVPLFLSGVMLILLATTSMGIFLGTMAKSMPQLGLLVILTILPMELLSGSVTPRESMPEFVQNIMLIAPTTHFVNLAQAILFRGAGLAAVWHPFAATLAIATLFFGAALLRFRSSIGSMQT